MSEIYLNGKYVGNVDNPEEFRNKIVEERRNNKLSSNLNVMYDQFDGNVYVENSKGRVNYSKQENSISWIGYVVNLKR